MSGNCDELEGDDSLPSGERQSWNVLLLLPSTLWLRLGVLGSASTSSKLKNPVEVVLWKGVVELPPENRFDLRILLLPWGCGTLGVFLPGFCRNFTLCDGVPGMGTARSPPPSVFSYFGVQFFKIGVRVPLGCRTRGREVVGEPISSRVFIVEVGEGILGTPGIGTAGLVVEGEGGIFSPRKVNILMSTSIPA